MVAMEQRPGGPSLDSRDAAEFVRRRRGRNYALLAVLVGLVVLFYAITLIKRAGLS